MKVTYTKHAKDKFLSLKKTGLDIKRSAVKKAILNPDSGPKDGRYSTKIVLKKIDKRRNLRVIYMQQGDIITVVTFYPVKRGRYEQK